jgi:integrase
VAEKLIKRGTCWYYRFTDADGVRRMRKGCSDKRATEGILRAAETDAARIRSGEADPKELAYRDHERISLSEHIAAWGEHLTAKGSTPKHVEVTTGRVRRVVALIRGARLSEVLPASRRNAAHVARVHERLEGYVAPARLSDLTDERVQKALATLRAEGQALETCNHYRGAVKSFTRWCYHAHRTRDDACRGVRGFNAEEDRRHDRRTISLEELRRLIDVTERGPAYQGMTGPVRALCYRLAVATGLRFSEIASIRPESFDWEGSRVRVAACYTKNGQTAELPLPADLVADLRPHVTVLGPGTQVFPLPAEKGAPMLRVDLKAAGIPYRDASGLVFDFHALRCQTATLADAAGVSPRVVQKLMRHSSLELTGRYTRPRAMEIEGAASLIPSLKPAADPPGAMAATGTYATHAHTLAPPHIHAGDAGGRSGTLLDAIVGPGAAGSTGQNPRETPGFDAPGRPGTLPDGGDRGAGPDRPVVAMNSTAWCSPGSVEPSVASTVYTSWTTPV